MPETLARIASLTLALTFMWATVAKVAGFERWRASLEGYRLPGPSIVVAVAVPMIEVALAVTLVFVSPRAGAAGAVAVLATFSLAILHARSAQGDSLPCGCFGGAERRDFKAMLGRNSLLGGLAAIVLLHEGGLGAIQVSMPNSGEVTPASLTLVGALLVAWITWQAARAMRQGHHR